MAWLFGPDAISEVQHSKPAEMYIAWLQTIAVDEQLTTTITAGELYCAAHRSAAGDRHLHPSDLAS